MRRLLSLVALGLLAGSCHLPIQRGRWNVLLVVVDSLRADHLGAYGYGRATSPRFDALAAGSYLFTGARAQASCPYPSVNSLLTSRYPAAFLGQPGGGLGIPAGTRSLPEVLAAAGWATGAVSASAVVRDRPGPMNPGGGFGRGFARFDDACTWRDADCVNRRGLEEVDRLREPFFLYLHYADPHAPYTPPQPFRHRLRAGESTRPWATRGNPHALALALAGGGHPVEHAASDVRFLAGLYDGEIAFLDDRLGALVAALRQRGVLDRTIVVVAGDHGESFLEHGTLEHCRTLFDEEIKTPLLLRLPTQRHGVRIDGAVQNLDIVPTLVDLLGLPMARRGFEGRSLLPLLEGGGAGERLAYAEIGARRSVTDGRHKLVRDLASGGTQLFDLARDPAERQDVSAREPEVLTRLQRALAAWMAHTEGPVGRQRSQEAEKQIRELGYL